jgi:quinoprotein relay system zinc metallohydrolase 1
MLAAMLAPPVAAVAFATAAAPARAADAQALDYALKPRELAPGVHVVEGANADFSPRNGCNIINTGFIVTREGVVVINTGPSRLYGEQLRRAIARVTPAPVLTVIHLNLHPDYFLGNQAFADVPRAATANTTAGMRREAKAYEDNLYRLCGDWMKGTEAVLPTQALQPGPLTLGGRAFELREYKGHTDSDLVLIDKASGVAFAGGLVFADRIPTTPHARVADWLASLQALESVPFKVLVPSHGPVRADRSALAQTREYLQWLDRHFSEAAAAGWDMVDLLRAPVPEAFRRWAAFETEYTRNVAHLYPRYERRALPPARP